MRMRMIEWSDAYADPYLKIDIFARTFHAANKSNCLYSSLLGPPQLKLNLDRHYWGLLCKWSINPTVGTRDQCCLVLTQWENLFGSSLNNWAHVRLVWKFLTLASGLGSVWFGLARQIKFNLGSSSTRLKLWSSGLACKNSVKVKRAEFLSLSLRILISSQ